MYGVPLARAQIANGNSSSRVFQSQMDRQRERKQSCYLDFLSLVRLFYRIWSAFNSLFSYTSAVVEFSKEIFAIV